MKIIYLNKNSFTGLRRKIDYLPDITLTFALVAILTSIENFTTFNVIHTEPHIFMFIWEKKLANKI